MISVDVKLTDNINKEIRSIQKQLKEYPQQAHDKFVELTPIRTGNARNRTRLKNKDTIEANYPYAERLDQGYSKQAPKGMTKPFEEWARKKIASIFGK